MSHRRVPPGWGALMAALNVKNRTLFIGDNIDFLRGINSETVDLIATDPPFNKGVKAFEGITKAGESITYKDVWTWSDVQDDWANKIRDQHPALNGVIQAANAAAGEDMGAFLCWLAVRVLECHRILKSTGTIYLHLDHTAGHWGKAMLDAIFGRVNFLGEIVWNKQNGVKTKTAWGNENDSIFCYAKRAGGHTFNVKVPELRKPFAKTSRSMHFNQVDADGRRYRERIVNGKSYFYYEDEGRFIGNLWNDIPSMKANTPLLKESTPWPTQKPLSLYDRIIKASSNRKDTVLDPFAGCATTCVAAERNQRHWIGIDVNDEAADVIRSRLNTEADIPNDEDIIISTTPPERTDDGEEAAPELRVASRQRNAPRVPVREIRKRLIGNQTVMHCDGCGWQPHREDYLQVDHVMPKARGGKDVMENYTLLCGPCNQRKSSKLTLAELRKANDEDGYIQDEEWAKMVGWR